MAHADRYIHGHGFGRLERPGSKPDLQVDDELVADLKEGLRVLTQSGYYPPVLRAHLPDKEADSKEEFEALRGPRLQRDGFVYGKTVDVLSSRDPRAEVIRNSSIPSPDKEGVWYGLELAEGVGALIEKGYIDQWSPGLYRNWSPKHEELQERMDKERLRAAPRHTAFVSIPAQKNLEGSSPHYRNFGEQPSGDEVAYLGEDEDLFLQGAQLDELPSVASEPNEEQGEGMDDDIKEKLEEVAGTAEANADAVDELGENTAEALEALGEKLDAIADAQEVDLEDDDKSAREKRLEEQLDQVRDDRDAMQDELSELQEKRARDLATSAGVEDEDKIEDLVNLYEDDPIQFTQKLMKLGASADYTSDFREPKGGNPSSSDKAPEDPQERMDAVLEKYDDVRAGDERAFDLYEEEYGSNFVEDVA